MLCYRPMQPEDVPHVQRLWEEETDWGPFEPAFRHWHLDNPCSGSFVVVAADECGRILGQFSFIALSVTVHGRTVRAARMFAPILGRTLRQDYPGAAAHEPILSLFHEGIRELRARQCSLMFALPHPRWQGFLQRYLRMRCAMFPLWSLPLPLTAPLPLGDGNTAAPLTIGDERVDRLWEATARRHACSVVRDARTLHWKTAGLTVTAVERNGELTGVVASGPKGEKPRQWEICDLLSADDGESLAATLRAAINVAQAQTLEESGGPPISQVAVLVTPGLDAHVRHLGFRRDAWDFPLMLNSLDDSLTDDAIAPELWYLSAND